jgi:hypothetical protein
MKISELFIGSKELLNSSITKKLILNDKINDINLYSLKILNNV